MTRSYSPLVVLAALIFFAAPSVGHASSGKCSVSKDFVKLKVILRFEKTRFGFGEAIKATVSILNNGESEISLPAIMQPEDYWLKFLVKNPEGRTIVYSGPEYKMRGEEKRVTLFPKYFFGTEISDLSTYYKMNVPGSYFIQAIYGISPLVDCPVGQHESEITRIELSLNK